MLDQVYVKAEDGKQSVGQYVAQVAKANGANIDHQGICTLRDRRGTREESREDFAAEVAKQMGM